MSVSGTLGASEAAGRFIVETRGSELDSADLRLARLSLIDTVAACHMGSFGAVAARLMPALASEDGAIQVAGTSLHAAPAAGALLFGALAHAQELDDWAGYGAAGAPVWGALLSLAQVGHAAGGQELAEAYCVGISAAYAIWSTGDYSQVRRGLDGTGVFGSVASAAACARLLGLDVDQAISALAIAASEFSGIVANLATDVAALHAGLAAKNGLQAALLAEAGLYGAADILEARQGLGEVCFGPAAGPLTGLAGALEQPAGVAAVHRFRHSPCAVDHQRVITAMRGLLEEQGWPAPEIAAIGVEGVPPWSEGVRADVPATVHQARASLRWSVAQVAHGQAIALEPTGEDLTDAAMAAMMDRVRIGIVPRWDPGLLGRPQEASGVWIATRDGQRASTDPRTLSLTLTDRALLEKWRDLSARAPDEWLDQLVERWPSTVDGDEPLEALGIAT